MAARVERCAHCQQPFLGGHTGVNVEPGAVPTENNLGLCVECGMVNIWHGDGWERLTREEFETFNDADRRNILAAKLALALAKRLTGERTPDVPTH